MMSERTSLVFLLSVESSRRFMLLFSFIVPSVVAFVKKKGILSLD